MEFINASNGTLLEYPGVNFSGGRGDGEINPDDKFFEELLAAVDSTLKSIEEENTSVQQKELNSADSFKRPFLVGIKPALWPFDVDREKTFESSDNIESNSPLVDINKIATDIHDKLQIETEDPQVSNEPLVEAHNKSELSNPTKVAPLKSQRLEYGICHANLSLQDVYNADDSDYLTDCELHTETSNITSSVSTVKPCSVFLKNCASLVEKHLTKFPACHQSTLPESPMSEVSDSEKVDNNFPKGVKSKKSGKKKTKKLSVCDDSTGEAEPDPGTSTNDDLNAVPAETINLGENIKETGKPIRRKRNSSSVLSEGGSVTIQPSKKRKGDHSLTVENPRTLQIKGNKRLSTDRSSIERDDWEIDSDYSSSKENMKRLVCKITKNVKKGSDVQREQISEDVEHSVKEMDKNCTVEESSADNDVSDANDTSITPTVTNVTNPEEEQMDYSALIKPCRVVLSKIEPDGNNKWYASSTAKKKRICYIDSDSSDSSDLGSKMQASRSKLRKKKLNNPMEDEASRNTDSNDSTADVAAKKKPRKSVAEEIPSTSNGLSRREKKSKPRRKTRYSRESSPDSDDSVATVPANEGSDADWTLPYNELYKLKKKSLSKMKERMKSRQNKPASDSSRSKRSGINRDLLELYENEFPQELKSLKKMVKRIEKKLDTMLKLHEQVLDCYE